MPEPELEIVVVADAAGWAEARRIREVVFCGEQACPPEEEFDAHDAAARHLLGRVDGAAVAVARWRVVEREGEAWAKLERFAILPPWRGRGLGRRWVAAVVDDARRHGHRRFLLHAQAHLEGLYAALGFRRVRDGFVEAGIPHVEMRRRADLDEAAGSLRAGASRTRSLEDSLAQTASAPVLGTPPPPGSRSGGGVD